MSAIAAPDLTLAFLERMRTAPACAGQSWPDDVETAAVPYGRVPTTFGVGVNATCYHGADETLQADYFHPTHIGAAQAIQAIIEAATTGPVLDLRPAGFAVSGWPVLELYNVVRETPAQSGGERVWHGFARFRYTVTRLARLETESGAPLLTEAGQPLTL